MGLRADLLLDPTREEEELRAYLGGAFDRTKLEIHDQLLDDEAERVGDDELFYRTSEGYLYDLTAFAMSGTKVPYLRLLTERVPRGSRLLDYGCGIGSDGLALLEAGYQVEFADFSNPSTEYLRWRLKHRGLAAPVHDLDVHVPGGFAAAYSFDVIEHVREPLAFLDQLERRADLVEVNFLEFDENEQYLHYELPIPQLLRHVAGFRLEAYELVHGSSHLVMYRSERAGRWRRLRNRARLATSVRSARKRTA